MDEQTLKTTIGKNITHYRKYLKMTQLELADRINYSDKTISKWERGEGVPDVFILSQLAECFGVTVNDLLCESTPPKPMSSKHKKIFVPILSVGLVWFVATVIFFVLKLAIPNWPWSPIVFLYAVPVSAIVLIVFSMLWWNGPSQFSSVTLLVWGMAVCFYISFHIQNSYMIFIVAGVFQLLTVFWFLFTKKK